jgi:hypothetical protein
MNPKPSPRVVAVRQHAHKMGGSTSTEFNQVVIKQVLGSLWTAHAGKEAEIELFDAAAAALAGIKPKDEIEGMLAAQMVAAHSASMECYRRAMHKDQTFEGRKEALNQANRLSRTYTMQMDALSRQRGKVSKRSRSSTSTSTPAARPLSVRSRPGVGWRAEIKGNPMQKLFPMHLSPRCGARTRSASPCRSPAMPNGRCRMHGGASPGAPKGKTNGNYRNGRFTRDAIARRRDLNALIRMLSHAAEDVV